MTRAVFSCIAFAMSVAIGFSAAAADEPAPEVSSITIAVAPFERDAPPGTAVPDIDWAFNDWSGDAAGNSNPTLVTVSGITVVQANFIQVIVLARNT